MEITQDNIEQLIEASNDLDMMKELARYAVKFQRDDLVEKILEKSIQINSLMAKLNSEPQQELQ